VDDRERIARLDSLSELECQTLYWLCRGFTRVEMADELCISESTVYKRMAGVWQKTGVDHLSGTQRLQALVQEFCPLILERVEDPERDCQQRTTATRIPDLEPDQETVEMVEEDEQNGIIPITQAIATRQSDQHSKQDIIVIPVDDKVPPTVLPPWLVPALLGAVIVLLAMNLLRQPQPQQPQVVGPTATLAPATPLPSATRSDQQGAATDDAVLPTYTPYPTPSPAPSYTPYPSPTESQLPTGTPRPTYTPYPTRPTMTPVIKEITWTPVPSPTEPETTPADAVLEVGEWWKQGTLWIRVKEVDFTKNGYVYVEFEMWNRGSNEILGRIIVEQTAVLTDNAGVEYRHAGWYSQERPLMAGPGETDRARLDYFGKNYFNSGVDDMLFELTDFSKTVAARWHITIP